MPDPSPHSDPHPGAAGARGDDRDAATRARYLATDAARAYAAELRHPIAQAITAGERRAVSSACEALGGVDGWWLDLAGGSGKLADARLGGRRISMDVSAAMLVLDQTAAPRAIADARHVPLADDAVDIVVVLRLLHGCGDDMVTRVVAETLRVARRGVVLSDMVPAPRWRATVRRGLGRSPERGGRDPAHLARLVAAGGGRVAVDMATLPVLSSGHVIAVRPA